MPLYRGSCHCGAVTFSFDDEPITAGVRCNCSICARRGAVMSDRYYARDEITISGLDACGVYIWGDRMMNHYFCRTCGIYPFASVIEDGRVRVNLGCVDGVDTFAVAIRAIDGRSF
jgi:hypothetical protein